MTRYLGAGLFALAAAVSLTSPSVPESSPAATETPRAPELARSLVGPAERQDEVMAVSEPPAAPLTSRAGRGASVAEVRVSVRAAAAEFGQDAEAMLETFWCESRWRNDRVGAAGERGFAQFWPPTWAEEAPLLGYGEEHAWQVDPQARVAAAMWAKGLAARWSCWRAAHAGG